MSIRLNPPTDSTAELDLLADIVSASHVGTLCGRGWYAGRWSFHFSARQDCGFHIVMAGQALMRLEDGREFALGPGDIALVSVAHVLASDLTVPPQPFDPAAPAQPGVDADNGDVCLLCGAYQLSEAAQEHRVFSNLPPVILLRAGQRHPSVDAMVQVLDAEFRGHSPGARTVSSRLIDAMLVYILRHWIASDCPRATGWLKALQDPVLGRTLALIHRRYAEPWTLDRLARTAGTSRASLARHFTAQVGTSPMQFLTQRRLDVARTLLHSSTMSLDEIAAQVGYASGFSLSKAFKRQFGEAPRHLVERDGVGGRMAG